MGTSCENLGTFVISLWFLFRMRSVTNESCRENQNTPFMFSNFFFSKNSAVYEILWKSMVTARQATDDNIIWHMRFVCWITKITDTLRICNSYCFSTATVVM